MAGILWLIQRAFGKARKHRKQQIAKKEKEKRQNLQKVAKQNPEDSEALKNWAKYYGQKKRQQDDKYNEKRRTKVMAQRAKGPAGRKSEARRPSTHLVKDPNPDPIYKKPVKRPKLKEERMKDVLTYLKEKASHPGEENLPQHIQDYNDDIRARENEAFALKLERAAALAAETNPFEAERLRVLANEARAKAKKCM